MIHTDDGIFIGPTQKDIQECYDILTNKYVDRTGSESIVYRAFKMTDEGDLSDYLGVKIEPLENGTIKLS